MHDSMLNKLDQLKNRIAEIETLLVDSETVKDIEKYTQLNKEFSELKPIVAKFDEYKKIIKSIDDANEIIKSGDEDLKLLAEDDLRINIDKPEALEQELKFMLLPKDSADDGSAYLEIRAGAGGDEAGIFAGDLFRMYTRLSEREGWNLEIMDIKPSEQGGLRKILVGTGDRSEKIRTYNFPQGRMTDHRIKLTQHNLDQIMDGDIKSICDALLAENQLAMLSQLESE